MLFIKILDDVDCMIEFFRVVPVSIFVMIGSFDLELNSEVMFSGIKNFFYLSFLLVVDHY